MSSPAALNPRDISTLERAVKRYQTFGSDASLGAVSPSQGKAEIWYSNPKGHGPGVFLLKIQKFEGEFGAVLWVIQIARNDGSTMTVKDIGQVSSNVLLFAITKAETLISKGTADRAAEDGTMKMSSANLIALEKLALTLDPVAPVQGFRASKRVETGKAQRGRSHEGAFEPDMSKLMAILAVQPEERG